jgi:hypothetical protein
MTTTPVSMSDPIYDKLVNSIRKTYPNACILFIDKITNNELDERFQNRYLTILEKRMIKDEPVEILELYHGTSEESMNNIIKNGFNKKYNKVSAWGKGTYFSPLATMSASYSKPKDDEVSYMFMCDVIFGKNQIGSRNKELTDDIDNYVNSLTNSSIICCPLDDMAIPRYVIAFHRNAK